MNRRTAIRNVVIISAGAAILPSCHNADKISLELKHLSITGSQEKLLAALSETIIPSTPDFIGAKDLKSHEFLLIMVDDCSSPEDQKKFTGGLAAFEDLCKKKWDRAFENCTSQQRDQLVSDIEQKKNIPETVAGFYGTVKAHTLQCFTTSREYMTEIRKYKLVPGPVYKGCVPVSNT
jgi:hypothetical protein